MSSDEVVTKMKAEGAVAFCCYPMTTPTTRYWRVRKGFVETLVWRNVGGKFTAIDEWALSTYTKQELEDHVRNRNWTVL